MKVRLALAGVVMIGAVWIGHAQANVYTAQEVLWIHQNRFTTATDLHVKFWQKEDNIDILAAEVLGTSGGLPMPDSFEFGWQPEPYHSQLDGWNLGGEVPDNGRHAVDLDWEGLNVPYCSFVDIEFRWWLTEYNTKRKEIKWSSDLQVVKHAPLFGWTVEDPVAVAGGWRHTVTIENLDSPSGMNPMPLYVSGMKYSALDSMAPLDIGDLHSWSDWQAAPSQEFTITPGGTTSFDVLTSSRDTRILGEFDALDSPGGDILITDRWDHSVPEPSTCILLMLSGAVLSQLRRRI